MAKIDINGVIVDNDDSWIYDWFGMESFSPSKLAEALNGLDENEDLEVCINSGGGSLYSGSAIYTTLKSRKGNVTTKVMGIAASAASIIAMAGKKVMMSPTAQLMIHNTAMWTYGDHQVFSKDGKVLKVHDAGIANAYMLKTGLSNDEIAKMMNQETYMDAKTALEKGFIDEIMFDEGNKLVASVSTSRLLPQEVISKMRNDKLKADKQQKTDEHIESYDIDLELLNLRRKKFNG